VSASPNTKFKSEFKPKVVPKSDQKAEDYIDPIYDAKCPISTSMKERKDAGAITSTVNKAGQAQPFSFEFKLNGKGAPIEEKKKEASIKKAPKANEDPAATGTAEKDF
jgi:hypothetical protein